MNNKNRNYVKINQNWLFIPNQMIVKNDIFGLCILWKTRHEFIQLRVYTRKYIIKPIVNIAVKLKFTFIFRMIAQFLN